MATSSQSNKIHLDRPDVSTIIKLLSEKADQAEGVECCVYIGAAQALATLYYHEYIDKPRDFITMFDAFRKDGEI